MVGCIKSKEKCSKNIKWKVQPRVLLVRAVVLTKTRDARIVCFCVSEPYTFTTTRNEIPLSKKKASLPFHVWSAPQCRQFTLLALNPDKSMSFGTSIPVGTCFPVSGHLINKKAIAERCKHQATESCLLAQLFFWPFWYTWQYVDQPTIGEQ